MVYVWERDGGRGGGGGGGGAGGLLTPNGSFFNGSFFSAVRYTISPIFVTKSIWLTRSIFLIGIWKAPIFKE